MAEVVQVTVMAVVVVVVVVVAMMTAVRIHPAIVELPIPAVESAQLVEIAIAKETHYGLD